jgi:hypothetical protein
MSRVERAYQLFFRQREQSALRPLIFHPVSALVHIGSENQGIGVFG